MRILILLSCLMLSISCAKESCTLDEVFLEAAKACAEAPCPPQPPASGPGSAVMPHAQVEKLTIEESLFNSYRSFLYIPASPAPAKAPVLLFLHGYFDATPERYDLMLSYYARNGYIVIYPGYGNAVYAKTWSENAEEAFKRSLAYLDAHSAVKPDRERVAFIGHSIGGILSFHLAQELGAGGEVPRPKLIVTSDAAGISTIAYPQVSIDDLSRIPSDTKILMMMAEETYRARFREEDKCENDAKKPASNCNGFSANLRVMKRSPQIPPANKSTLLIASDPRGTKGLRSDHNGAQGECRNEKIPINAIDTWGYWRHTLTALNAEFKGADPASQQRKSNGLSNGIWSDGHSAKPALSLDSCFLSSECPVF